MLAPLLETPTTPPELMTVKEVVEYLRLPLATVYYLLQRGRLPGIRIGGRWRIKRSLVDKNVLKKEDENDWRNPKTKSVSRDEKTQKNPPTVMNRTSISVVFDDQLLGSLATSTIARINHADRLAVHDRVVSYVDFILTDRDIGYEGSLPSEFAGRIVRIVSDEELKQGQTSDTPITEITALEFGKDPTKVLRKVLELS